MKLREIRIGRTFRIAVELMIMALMLAGNAGADTLFVSGSSTNTLTVNAAGGADFTKIQDAIDAASDGYTILVSGGVTSTLTYYENVDVNKQIVLQGLNEGFGQPVVDAGGTQNAIKLSYDGINLTGFRLINSGVQEGDAGIKVLSNNNVIKNNIATNNVYGINLHSSISNILSDNTVSNNAIGFLLNSSENNTFTGNIASYNNYEGFFLKYSDANTITGNTVNYNTFYSIDLYYSNGNSISNNNVSNNYDGIVLRSSDYNDLLDNNADFNNYYGIFLYKSNYNLLNRNTVRSNDFGIRAEFSNNNTLSKNTVSLNNIYGISMDVDNKIYNNYFNNNNNFQNIGGYGNIWNITKRAGINVIGGPYLGGNYWADPAGTGFSQNCPDNDVDGICDTVYVLDSNNIDYLPLTNNGPDAPPTADAGLDKVANTTETVFFDGSGSTDNNGIVLYEWDFTSDGTYDATGITATNIYNVAGNYTVTLRVTDTAGQTDTDTAIVVVSGVDEPPVADAGPEQLANTGDAVFFDGSGSTDDIAIVLYEWDFESDGIYDAEGMTTSHIYNTPGNYTVTLKVADSTLQVDTDTAYVVITNPDFPPLANAGPDQSVLTGDTAVFDGSGSTDDNGIVLYEWDFESDGTYDAAGMVVNHSYSTAGTYTVTLRVTDTVGQMDTDTSIATVTDPDYPPVANAGPDQSILTGDTAVFDGSGSTDDNGIVLYEWDFESDGTYDATGVTASRIYSTAGTYTVTLRVTDATSQSDTDTAIVTVSDPAPPQLDINGFATDKANYNSGELVTAMATVKNNFGSIVNNVFVDFVYSDPTGAVVHTDTQKIKRLNIDQSKDSVSTYTLDSNALTGTYTVEASVRWDIQTYDTEQTTFDVTGSPPSNVIMHVEAIDFSTKQKGRTEALQTKVTILDDSLAPVSGATVEGTLNLPDSTAITYSGSTLADGTVTFEYSKKNQPLQAGTYVFTVTDAVKSGATYDQAQNKETTDSFTK